MLSDMPGFILETQQVMDFGGPHSAISLFEKEKAFL